MAAYTNKTPVDVVAVLLLKTIVGAFVIRGAACTVNDIFDREFDAAVGELISLCCVARVRPNPLLHRTHKESPIGKRKGLGVGRNSLPVRAIRHWRSLLCDIQQQSSVSCVLSVVNLTRLRLSAASGSPLLRWFLCKFDKFTFSGTCLTIC